MSSGAYGSGARTEPHSSGDDPSGLRGADPVDSQLERFLTPVNAPGFKLVVRRELGHQANGESER